MTDDLNLQDREDEFAENRARAICFDAAIFVAGGSTRDSAIEQATNIFEAQRDADGDVTGVKATLEEAQSPQVPEGKKSKYR